jgi:hypothetical protein
MNQFSHSSNPINRMKQNLSVIVLIITMVFIACKTKEAEKKEPFFPILSFIRSQVAHVDTSLYQIIKLTGKDSTWDTTYIKREEFRNYAGDFLQLPDLTEKKYSSGYEESKFFDASLNRVIITYTPKDKGEEVQREEVTIEPDSETGDKVKNIVVDQLINSKDSAITKRMLWNVDESFQVTTIIQKQGHEDSAKTMRIKWQ